MLAMYGLVKLTERYWPIIWKSVILTLCILVALYNYSEKMNEIERK